jgi:Lipoxygenase
VALRHVADYHIGWANSFHLALRQALPQNHGLRAFLKPYTHGSGTVNWNAYQMLIKDNSILHRASGLTRRGRGFCFGHIQRHMDWTATLPVRLESKKLDGMYNLTQDIPMFTNGMRLWNIHRRFTESYINLIYPDDESLESDAHLHRFWNHINTFGRHTDPCVCGMDDELFFEEGAWPSIETTRTCQGLLDHVGFMTGEDQIPRRQKWCKRHAIERKRALHRWLEDDCEADPKCPGLSYEFYHMRPNMGLPSVNRKILIDVLTNFMNEVTVGHEMAADNIPYMVDPSYGGVRVLKWDPMSSNNTKLPYMVDIATYAFGTAVSALTTIRSLPLVSDWSNLLVYWIDVDNVELKRQVKKLHLQYKTELMQLSNAILKESLTMPKNRWAPYMIPATQASSVAV